MAIPTIQFAKAVPDRNEALLFAAPDGLRAAELAAQPGLASNPPGRPTSCQPPSSGSGLIPGILRTALIGAAKKTTLYAGPDCRVAWGWPVTSMVTESRPPHPSVISCESATAPR